MKSSYYTPDDQPSDLEREAMWSRIKPTLPANNPNTTILIHWRSFMLGSAAALLLLFAGVGVWTVSQTAALTHRPKVEAAYADGMRAIATITPVLVQNIPDEKHPLVESTILNIEDIDEAIAEIELDIQQNGTSEIKRRQLRVLFGMKMDYLKELLLMMEDEQ